MALKLTSKEGKVQQLVGTPLTCYLYDFDIDGATLKPEHLNWLDQLKQKVVDPTKSSGKGAAGLYVWLYGNASRTGDDAHNIGLSTRRALEVNNVVERKLVGIPHFTIVIPQGEALAKQRGWEDDTEPGVSLGRLRWSLGCTGSDHPPQSRGRRSNSSCIVQVSPRSRSVF